MSEEKLSSPAAVHIENNNSTETSAGQYLNELYLLFICNLIEALEHILLATLVYVMVCLVIYILLFRPKISKRFNKCNHVNFPKCKRALFVTAHPDDESMFFGPTILTLSQRPNCQVHLLCLSNGNFEKNGKTRQTELWNACKHLNIKDENITVINATHLQDDPNLTWKNQVIAKQILKQVHSLDIDAVITFDRDGISHHPNHSAIFYASTSIYLAGLMPEDCRIYTLDSVNVCRKYIFLFDLIVSLILSAHWCIVNWKNFRLIQHAMYEHKSQMVWFRKLYATFSRYMIINTLREMSISDAELEMQIAESKNS